MSNHYFNNSLQKQELRNIVKGTDIFYSSSDLAINLVSNYQIIKELQ